MKFGLPGTLALGLLAAGRQSSAATFGDEVAFLKQHTDVVVLIDNAKKSEVVVAPAWQGRVMTSTADGDDGPSYGWINRSLIASGKLQPHINVFGGEDRFWIGPEGGQFALFFAKGVPFDLEHWFTPAPIDTMPYPITRQTKTQVDFGAQFSLTNYSGTTFEVKVDRRVKLLTDKQAWHDLHLKPLNGLNLVAYQSVNKISNAGSAPWTKDTGLLSSYNDGPPSPGAKPLGPFYEMESSSPAAALLPGASLEHTHRTIHLSGSKDSLDAVARSVLGVSLAEIENALAKH